MEFRWEAMLLYVEEKAEYSFPGKEGKSVLVPEHLEVKFAIKIDENKTSEAIIKINLEQEELVSNLRKINSFEKCIIEGNWKISTYNNTTTYKPLLKKITKA